MRLFIFLTIVLTSLFASETLGRPIKDETALKPINGPTPWVRFSMDQQKAAVDTVYIMGGPDRWDGSFETPGGQPDWHGWTHEDLTVPEVNHWHVSTYRAEYIEGHGIGNHVMYCGDETIPACSEEDTIGGVGDNFFDDLDWIHVVADPYQASTVRLTGKLNYDLTDADWDFLELFIRRGADQDMLASWTGTGETTQNLDFTTVIDPGEYTGFNSDEIRLWWRVWSDQGYSDIDCLAAGHGACQLDDISVFINDELITFDDFEPGSVVSWNHGAVVGVGDFANLRNDLGSGDPCQTNNTYQANFVDDGTVQPTGGTPCVNSCYDPGGWIVNNDGGLLAHDSQDWFLENRISSPPIAWVLDNEAAELSFDVFVDETLHAASAGVFYQWEVRSTASEDPEDLQSAQWENRNFVHYGGPEYRRHVEPVGDLLVPDRKWVQIALIVNELGWIWGWNGADGTPAPYFDNVALKTWSPEGPEILVKRYHLFADAFPAAEHLDPDNLAANSCRVDVSVLEYNVWDVGDSMTVKVTPTRFGSTISQPPSLHWALQCNPLFDSVRQDSPNTQGILRGMVTGSDAINSNGSPMEGYWTFDLPDQGWFYPGDVLHYYITAADELDGDIRTSVWPADTTGVIDFTPDSLFPQELVTRALPTLAQPAVGQFSQPSLLIVDSDNNPEESNVWVEALRYKSYTQGVDFDVLKLVNGYVGVSSSTTVDDLAGYETIIYTSGSNRYNVMAEDPEHFNDVALFNSWLDTGNKQAFFAGDGLWFDLNGNDEGPAFRSRFGVDVFASDISTINGGHRNLQINTLSGNGVLPDNFSWIVDGGCPDIKFTDAIGSFGGGQSAATLDAAGIAGGPYSAVVANDEPASGNRTIALPYDLASVAGSANRADFLEYLLAWLSSDLSAVGDTPVAGKVTASAHPNPFNPSTTIAFELPENMSVSLDVFDVQGRHVRSLLDETPHLSGRHNQVWDGRNARGQNTASGVYFFRLKAGDQEHVGKLTLLK